MIKEQNYWVDKLNGKISRSSLSMDRKHAAWTKMPLQTYSIDLPESISREILSLANGSDYRVHTLLLGTVCILLAREAQEDHALIATTSYYTPANPTSPVLLPIHVLCSSDMPLNEFFISVGACLFEANKAKPRDLKSLFEVLELKYDTGNCPLFDIGVFLKNIQGLQGEEQIHFSAAFVFERIDNHIVLAINFDSLRFSLEGIRLIAARCEFLLTQIVGNIKSTIGNLQMLPPSEKNLLLNVFNSTDTIPVEESFVYEYLARWARTTPDAVAVQHADRTITYREMNNHVNKLANLLGSMGIGSGHSVAIAIDRSIDMMSSIIAVWKVGGSYIPIDINYPLERIEVILRDAAPFGLIVRQNNFERDSLLEVVGRCVHIKAIVYLDKSDKIIEDNYILRTQRLANSIASNDNCTILEHTIFANQNILTPQEAEGVIEALQRSLSVIGSNSSVGLIFKNPIYQIVTILALRRNNLPFCIINRHDLSTAPSSLGIDTIITEVEFIDETDNTAWRDGGLKQYLIIDEYDYTQSIKQSLVKDVWEFFATQETFELNDYGWTNSYNNEKFSIAEMNEHICNFSTKLFPFLNGSSRVLEIGCGHGLVLFEIAHRVKYFLATDPVYYILERNKGVAHQKGLTNVDFQCLSASEISRIKERNFDIVLCSSIVQYFPNTIYLEEVIKSSIELLADQGIIYLDDLLDLERREEFMNSLRKFKEANPDSKTKLTWDDDLFVSRNFFTEVVEKIPQVEKIEFSRKLGRIKNELTSFRYDVIIRVNKKLTGSQAQGFASRSNLLSLFPKNQAVRRPDSLAASFRIIVPYAEFESMSEIFTDVPFEFETHAYTIYTSGSTGTPKGAMVEHFGMMNHIHAKIADLNLGHNSIIAQNGSHTFDISVWQFFTALVVGGKTVIYDNDTIRQLSLFASSLTQDGINILEVVPSFLAVLIEHYSIDFSNLKFLIVTGEDVKPSLINRCLDKFPKLTMVNAYGPTEASDDVTHFVTQTPVLTERTPIGKPIQNFRIYVVDSKKQICPIGIKGEIWVSGIGIGKGYLGQPEKTAQVFCSDPFSAEPRKLYKTGDIGRWLPDGNLEFIERNDSQVKIRGHRIELSEIEHQIVEFSGIEESVLICHGESGDSVLYAFYRSGYPVAGTELKKFLLSRLPEYMVPSFFIQLERMPLSENGKIDKKALREKIKSSELLRFVSKSELKIILSAVKKRAKKRQDGSDLSNRNVILSEGERKHLLEDFNNTNSDFKGKQLVHALIEEYVVAKPEGIAIIFERVEITYRDINTKANQLAHYLKLKGVTRNTIVALLCERTPDMLVGMLAILKAGGAYLPIDPAYPQARQLYMLNDSNVAYLLTERRFAHTDSGVAHTFLLEDDNIYHSEGTNLSQINKPNDLAYITYTSGSTGNPKGVMITHASCSEFIKWSQLEFKNSRFSLVYALTSICFDLNIFEIFYPLSCGIRIRLLKSGEDVKRFIVSDKDILLNTVPSFVSRLIDTDTDFTNVTVLNMAGEPIPYYIKDHLDCDKIEIRNLYGPSEDTTYSTMYRFKKNDQNIPIGRPISNTKIFILDPATLELMPLKESGEIFISSSMLAKGYLNRAALTEERFLPNPFLPGQRMYRTGDIGRWLENGDIEFLGRLDHQIKLNGFRIEPEEVEAMINRYPGIQKSCIVLSAKKDAETCLIAFVEGNTELRSSGIREFLLEKLPTHMIPSFYFQLEQIPITSTGKIDRKTLNLLDGDQLLKIEIGQARNDVDKKIIDIWCEILGVIPERIGVHSDFFELGGNSLKAIVFLAKVKSEFGVALSPGTLFAYSKLTAISDEIAGLLANQVRQSMDSEYIKLNDAGSINIFLFPPIIAYGIIYSQFKEHLSDYSLYAFNFIESDDRIDRYVNTIIDIQPEGPYNLLGYSAPGELMLKIASELELRGNGICNLIFLDCTRTSLFDSRQSPDLGMLETMAGAQRRMLQQLNVDYLAPTVISKMVNYYHFLRKPIETAQLNSYIYLITSENREVTMKDEIHQLMSRVVSTNDSFDFNSLYDYINFENISYGKVNFYKGFGRHDEMLYGNNVQKNCEIISSILKKLNRKYGKS